MRKLMNTIDIRSAKKSANGDSKFLAMAMAAMPRGIDIAAFKALAPHAWWEDRPRLAFAYALRKSPDINWQAYLDADPGLARLGMDPVLHFINDGVFEGRKLKLAQAMALERIDAPKVSVVIANYNNGLFLEKCIYSALRQTLADIEIIIVDDCSTDSSLALAKTMERSDKRIKVISRPERGSQHMARKNGAAAATGQYIMFLDSDDFYAPNACEVAYNAISKGLDIVAFGAQAVCPPDADPAEADSYHKYMATPKKTFANAREALRALFITSELPIAAWAKIYRADLCKKAFAEMEDGYYPRAQDLYEALALFSRAARIASIDDKLYVYRALSGVSRLDSKVASAYARTGALARPVGRWCRANGLSSFEPKIRRILLRNSLDALYAHVPPEMVTEYMNGLVAQYGVNELMDAIVGANIYGWKKVAGFFQHYRRAGRGDKPLKTIGILYNQLVNGGIESVLPQLCALLVAKGYKVVLFLHEPGANDSAIPEEVERIYLGKYEYSQEAIKRHLRLLREWVEKLGIQMMLYHRPHRQSLLWEAMLLRLLNIPTMLFEHSAYYIRMFTGQDYFRKLNYEAALKCLDKVFVLSDEAEIYYHTRGVNAAYVHNPIPMPEPANVPFEKRRNNIAFVARFSDPVKQTLHCLAAFRKIINRNPFARLKCVGEFGSEEDRNAFDDWVGRLGIGENLDLIDWTADLGGLLDQCALVIGTSFTESFSLVIAEAQARGLPAVIYDIPIMAALANPAIIRVAQGEYEALAKEACALMDDKPRWKVLSGIARNSAARFSPESYIERVVDILENHERRSPIAPFDEDAHKRTIKTLAWYGSADAPKNFMTL